MSEAIKQRPGTMRLLDAITGYRYPVAAIVSILHRISGGIMFVLLPLVIWMFDTSVTSEISFERFKSAFNAGLLGLPGWFIKLVVLALMWSYLLHFAVGVRHLWMDVTHSVSREQGQTSANAAWIVSTVLTVVLGAKLFGLY